MGDKQQRIRDLMFPAEGEFPSTREEREVKKGLGKRAGRRRRTENAQELRVRCAKHICRASW